MSIGRPLVRRFATVALVLTLGSAVGCSPEAAPEKTPEDLEQIRTEMRATSQRELSGSK